MKEYQQDFLDKIAKDAANDKIFSWDEYFMMMAFITSLRSKDPNTRVGACIVNNDNKVLSLGYNGFPNGVSDNDFPWEKGNKNDLDNKYPYVVHAELNAILNANTTLIGATIYVTLSPCNECAKAIIQAGIKRVVYLMEYVPKSVSSIASRKLLRTAGVELIPYRHLISNK